MTVKNEYLRMGKFIYSACRYGGDSSDVYKWMGDDLGIALPPVGDHIGQRELYTAFLAKYDSDSDFQTNYESFVEAMKGPRR